MRLSFLRHPGIAAALGAALLFGAGTPLAKRLLQEVSPWLLAALLYLGSGLGLSLYRRAIRAPRPHLPPQDRLWFFAAIAAGGVVAPLLLLWGLSRMPASGASLLLNAEGVFTALLAWLVFRENVDRRVAAGMLAIVAGVVILSWPGEARFAGLLPTLAILAACLAWAIDNNLTRKVSLADATWIAAVKGVVAGSVNLLLALAVGATLPPVAGALAAMAVGFVAYGISLALFVIALRHLGTSRTGAYFALAPFVGAVISLGLGEPVTGRLLAAAALMALGLWLHLTEHHAHEHTHAPIEHEHEHVHDEHHQHEHDAPVAPGTKHRHRHRHAPLTHTHEHFPDAHHQHDHRP